MRTVLFHFLNLSTPKPANLIMSCYDYCINAPASRKVRWGFMFYKFHYTKNTMQTTVFIDGENFRKSIRFVIEG